MESSLGPSGALGEKQIFLDGVPVELPSGQHSLSALRSYLEIVSLEKQSALCSLTVDGLPLNLGMPLPNLETFSRIEAESVTLEDSEIMLLKTALQQTRHVRQCVETALTLVLINDGHVARELCWNLAQQMKGPIVTLSLLPDHLCNPSGRGVSFQKLRKWQLEQVANITREVDRACRTGDTLLISDVLEKRVLPWLCKLENFIDLSHETTAASRMDLRDRGF